MRKKKNFLKNRIAYLWFNSKRCDISVIVTPGGEEKWVKEIFEGVITVSFPKLITYTKPQIQEDQKTPDRVEKHKQKSLHLSVLYSKCKKSKREKILKETKRKKHLNI